jgi:hypothetical protein
MTATDIDAPAPVLELNPLRLYDPQQARQVMFGENVADNVHPTVNWLKRQAGLGQIDCTKVGRFTYFSADDIRALIETCARGLYGRPKNPRGKRK